MPEIFTDENFEQEVLKSKVPVFVDFFAEWCGPCKKMKPVVETLAKKYKGKIKIGKYNLQVEKGISEEYGIKSIPTLIFFKDGKIVQQMMGFREAKALEVELDKLL